MKRLTAAFAVLASTAAAVLVLGAVSAGAESGPNCADITGETHNYRGTGTAGGPPGPYTLGVELLLAAPACKQIVYTLYVVQDAGSTPVAFAPSGLSTAGNPTFQTTINDDDATICIYAETATKGGKVFDRAPDASCLEFTAPASGGASGFG